MLNAIAVSENSSSIFFKNSNIQGQEMYFHEAIFYITGEMGVTSEKRMMFEKRRILMKQEKGKKRGE